MAADGEADYWYAKKVVTDLIDNVEIITNDLMLRFATHYVLLGWPDMDLAFGIFALPHPQYILEINILICPYRQLHTHSYLVRKPYT